MNMKSMILLMALLIILPIGMSSFITEYKVTPEIPLGQEMQISGIYIDDLNLNKNIYCEYRVFDTNNYEVYRASDSTTDLLGRFSKKIVVSEPTFKRGTDYNAVTICKYTTVASQFSIIQKEDLSHSLLWEFKYFTDTGNLYPVLFLIIIIALIIGVPYTIHRWINSRSGG